MINWVHSPGKQSISLEIYCMFCHEPFGYFTVVVDTIDQAKYKGQQLLDYFIAQQIRPMCMKCGQDIREYGYEVGLAEEK